MRTWNMRKSHYLDDPCCGSSSRSQWSRHLIESQTDVRHGRQPQKLIHRIDGGIVDRSECDSVRGSAGPLLVSASNCRYVATFPRGSDQLFAADVEVRRDGSFTKTFEAILFAEGSSLASIYGIEFEDGYPKGLVHELASKQQDFIRFLRSQNEENARLLGPLAKLFSSHEYSSELAATQAYLRERKSAFDVGLGYFDGATNEYLRISIESDHQSHVEERTSQKSTH